MLTTLNIILLILGLILYLKKINFIMLYWLSLFTLLLPICSLICKCITYDSFYALVNNIRELGRNLFALLVFIEILKKYRIPKLTYTYYSFFFLIAYLTISGIFINFSINALWGYLSEVLSLILPLIFMLLRKDAIPQISTLKKFIILVIVIQLIIAPLNLIGIYVFLPFYFPNIIISETGQVIESHDESLVMGTFSRYNMLANFLTTIYLFLALEYFSKKNISRFKFYSSSIIILLIILLTGAKISLALFAIIITLCSTIYIKNNFKICLLCWSSIIICIMFLLTFDYTTTDNNAGIDRHLKGFAKYFQSDIDDENNSTIGLSTYLFKNYLDNDPLFGNRLSYKGEFAYGNLGMCTLTHFRADSRIAYTIIEVGLIGFILYLFFFGTIFMSLSSIIPTSERKKLIIIFIYFFILTITEGGFFDRWIFPLCYLYVLTILYNSNIHNRIYEKKYTQII